MDWLGYLIIGVAIAVGGWVRHRITEANEQHLGPDDPTTYHVG